MATNAFLAQCEQIAALATVERPTWDTLYPEAAEAEAELDAFNKRLEELEAKAEAATIKAIGAMPARGTDAWRQWHKEADAIRAKVVPELNALQHKFDAVLEHTRAIQWALMDIPAPDAAALQWKVQFLYPENDPEAYGDSVPAEQMAVFVSDIRRLLAA